jgi:phosphopantetheinyl transferase
MSQSIRDDDSETEHVKPLEIHVALARVNTPLAADALERWSSDDDRAQTKRPEGQLCRALLRGVLAQTTHLSAHWQIGKAESGKPYARHRDGAATPSISISHSGPWSACVVSFEGDVGIDIERLRCDRDLAGIAGRAFGPRECSEVAAEGCNRFYTIWTLREAMAKAVGAGLVMAADGTDRVAGGAYDDFRRLSVDGESWQVIHQMPQPDLSLAIALRLPGDRLHCRPVLRHWFTET